MDESKKAKILEQFGETLKAERLKAGLSQEHLADLAELDRTYVGSTERGERNISLINIVKLAGALGVRPANLLKGIR